MEGYDPSPIAILRRRLASAFHKTCQLLPVWNPSAEPLDPNLVLNPREMEIFRLYGLNRTSKEIAVRLFISFQSADTHLAIISRRLRIRRRDLRRVAKEFIAEFGV